MSFKVISITPTKNIECSAYTPMNAAKKLAKYDLSFTIQNNNTKKIYEYTLTHSDTDIIVKPKKITTKGGNMSSFKNGMLFVLRIQDKNKGYLTLDTGKENIFPAEKGTKLKTTQTITEKSIFIFSKFRSDSNLARFVNMYQDKFYNHTTYTKKVDRNLNIIKINNEYNLALTDTYVNFPLEENSNGNYYINMSFYNLPNIEVIPYYKYASFTRTVRNREAGVKSYIGITKPKFKTNHSKLSVI
jgi:hypothetical protein